MFPRLPRTPATKAKISKALTGRKHSDATKAKIAATMTGRKHSPDTIAKLRAARAKPRETAVEYTRRRKRAEAAERAAQHRADKYAAARLGDRELLIDVIQSGGQRSKRRVFDQTGRVSHGDGPPRVVALADQWVDRYFEVQDWLDEGKEFDGRYRDPTMRDVVPHRVRKEQVSGKSINRR